MKPKFRNVLELAIGEGVRYGYSRAFKHNLNPTENDIVEHVIEQVINSLDDWFDFEENNDNL